MSKDSLLVSSTELKTQWFSPAKSYKSFNRIHKLNRIKKERQRTFIVVCPDCLTEFIIKDLDVEIICPICNEMGMEE